jgi:2-oxoglutarate dehydrogenase E1 component
LYHFFENFKRYNMDDYSYVGNGDVNAIEDLYNQYKKDPQSVDASWHNFFKGFEFSKANYDAAPSSVSNVASEHVEKEFKVINLINAYRKRGHLFTKTNPVRTRRNHTPTLEIENFGLTEKDLETKFQAAVDLGLEPSKLSEIVAHLKLIYCKSIGWEASYMRNPELLGWIRDKIEKSINAPHFDIHAKKDILQKLTQAVTFENFLATKFVGQKRFSLEGAEALIPALEFIIEKGSEMGVEEVILGMPHRGRLNVLANILKKDQKDIFTEFEGRRAKDEGFSGDVKYHLGFSSDYVYPNGKKVHISLTPNPSHLEAVDPVLEGITRAKADNKYKSDYSKIVPIMIHGDAAVAGQGVVYEVIQMMHLDGFKTGGTIHLVVNNQVGFTTNYLDARSSTYCTDIAKVVLCPVFHVNGDDAEAVVFVSKVAIEFRQLFKRDVFIDILCYRKYGHNEGDEPRFTQPLLYKAIAAHDNSRKIYADKLIEQAAITEAESKQMESDIKDMLQKKLDDARAEENSSEMSYLQGVWKGLQMADDKAFEVSPETGISEKIFLDIAKKSTTLPKDKNFFNKIVKLFEDRSNMIANDNYDWAMGELMAYATLMHEGHNVRFSGQDVERGTFSHRHAIVKMEDSEEEYTPLNNLGTKGELRIYNSHLSEYGVLGFEYGYAFASPNDLVIWEAQFGDFMNGAQIIFDQFVTSAEYKWRRMNSLVVLLPHGYEGQGPEHSSARMERFLQMCAENNIQIINATTPANQFHALRRQLKRDFRKPMICFTPKKLLRYPTCVSKLKDFTKDKFHEVIDDAIVNAKEVTSVAFCSGKIYYDLLEKQQAGEMNDIAIVRVEQLYPLPYKQLDAVVAKYKNAKNYIWVQEEPENMGAWSFMHRKYKKVPLQFIGRDESASPATGYSKAHAAEQEGIVNAVFAHSKVKVVEKVK